MKNFKKLAAAAAALAMTATLAVPMTAMFTSSAADNTITITATDLHAKHTYGVYQIFTGEYASSNILKGTIAWGASVAGNDEGATFLSDLQTEFTGTFDSCTTAADVLAVIGTWESNDDDVKAFADFVGGWLKENTVDPVDTATSDNGYKVNGLADGYYFIQDESNPTGGEPNSDAQTRYMLQVFGGTDLNVAPKQAAPTVDKSVSDDDTVAKDKSTTDSTKDNGTTIGDYKFYETADHTLYDTFQFKLEATIPENNEIDEYSFYTLEFVDAFSKGVTYKGNLRIMIFDGETEGYTGATFDKTLTGAQSGSIQIGDSANATYDIDVEVVQSTSLAGGTLNVKIPDLKKILGSEASLQGVRVVITYDAELNSYADFTDGTGGFTSNENDVSLKYSNNPNDKQYGDNDSTGETPKDFTWIYTYKSNTNKEDSSGNPLANAKFKLCKDSEGEPGEAISLIWDETANAWRPATAAEILADQEAQQNADTYAEYSKKVYTEITTTNKEGNLNFVGLDEGTYWWVETAAPDDTYNLADPFKIVFGVTEHKEKAEGGTPNTANEVTLTAGSGENTGGLATADDPNVIINSKGAELPETGGIGTTLFYVVGGALVVGAGVTLITKKRMQKN